MSRKRKRIFILVSILTILLIFLLASLIISNFHIKITKYTYESENDNNVRIAFLTDLHGRSFGKDNKKLLSKIESQSPDIICLGGDFVDETNTDKDIEEFVKLVENMGKIAPVYYSYGNHDLSYIEIHGDNVIKAIENVGCTVLDERYEDITINGKAIRLGGIYDYTFRTIETPKQWLESSVYNFMTDFTSTDKTTVLLCHRPDCFFYNDALDDWNINLVLCGHTHGGLWRLPFIGGLVAPDQGFFPEFDYGEFDYDNMTMIISSGFAGHGKIPRMFNTPEIEIIDIN